MSLDRPPWHSLAITEVRAATGATTWELAKARMEGGGLPAFDLGTFTGNRSHYVAGFIQRPGVPFWQVCREYLASVNLLDSEAAPEAVWGHLATWEGIGLFDHRHRPKRSLLPQIEPLFWASAENSAEPTNPVSDAGALA